MLTTIKNSTRGTVKPLGTSLNKTHSIWGITLFLSLIFAPHKLKTALNLNNAIKATVWISHQKIKEENINLKKEKRSFNYANPQISKTLIGNIADSQTIDWEGEGSLRKWQEAAKLNRCPRGKVKRILQEKSDQNFLEQMLIDKKKVELCKSCEYCWMSWRKEKSECKIWF